MLKLSVIVPIYNERRTIDAVISRIRVTGLAWEIVAVDDGSSDESFAVLLRAASMEGASLRMTRHEKNRGKGAAIRTGLALLQGDLVLVQDADLEYDPSNYSALLAPFEDASVQVVYGSRNLQENPRSSWSFYWGGRLLSWITNLLYGSQITDEATGYKVVRTTLMRELDLQAEGFDFCAELTGKLLKRGIKIHEVPISYHPRSRANGKKIRSRDGWTAIWMLCRQRFSRRK